MRILKVVMTNSDQFSNRVRESAIRILESGAPALSGLYDLTAVRLLRLAVTITRNQHDAEDAVQAALLKVVVKPEVVVHADAPWAYLLCMVRNESLVILRKKRRYGVFSGITDLLTRRSVDELEREDTYRAVWLALRKLPVEQSEIVVLKIWEEMTFAEIGQVLSCSASTCASRYRYALQKLSVLLQSCEEEVVHE